jgi:predicted  nucleic acid-binding Zn-ribbon protein
MANIIDQVKEKQGKVRKLQEEATRKLGRKEQLLKQLKADFETDSKEEAQALLEDFKEVKKQNAEILEEIDKELGEIISSAQARTAE